MLTMFIRANLILVQFNHIRIDCLLNTGANAMVYNIYNICIVKNIMAKGKC